MLDKLTVFSDESDSEKRQLAVHWITGVESKARSKNASSHWLGSVGTSMKSLSMIPYFPE